MAADRAAELTEAYRILSDQARREEYDRTRAAGAMPTKAPSAPSKPAEPEAARTSAREAEGEPAATGKGRAAFTAERASRDQFVRKATIDRFKHALSQITAGYDESEVRGFDIARVPKTKLFGRGKGPRLLGRFVSCVDAAAVTDAWMQAEKWTVPSNEEICVFLMGSGMAPSRELAEAIAKQRRQPVRGGKVILIPVDARNWDAHVPTDAPEVVKSLLAQLRGARR